MKRSNFYGRKLRRQYVAGTVTVDQFRGGLDAIKRGTRTTKAAVDRDPKLLDLPRRIQGAS
jgi:hypothetical protein